VILKESLELFLNDKKFVKAEKFRFLVKYGKYTFKNYMILFKNIYIQFSSLYKNKRKMVKTSHSFYQFINSNKFFYFFF